VTVEHLDEAGQPCSRHPAATLDELMFLSVIGSRAPGFHHDVASKLQGLMMSIEEIIELGTDVDPQIARAAETANDALRDILALLNVNRSLTKPPTRAAVTLADLLKRAAERVYVSLTGELVEATVEVSAPSMVHALSLVFDVAGGPGRGRTLAATARLDDTHVELRLTTSPSPPHGMAESIAIATYVLRRDRGSLHCTADPAQFVVRLPLAAR